VARLACERRSQSIVPPSHPRSPFSNQLQGCKAYGRLLGLSTGMVVR
jgi:hypothetical protein